MTFFSTDYKPITFSTSIVCNKFASLLPSFFFTPFMNWIKCWQPIVIYGYSLPNFFNFFTFFNLFIICNITIGQNIVLVGCVEYSTLSDTSLYWMPTFEGQHQFLTLTPRIGLTDCAIYLMFLSLEFVALAPSRYFYLQSHGKTKSCCWLERKKYLKFIGWK